MSRTISFEELENQDRLENNCGHCGIELTEENKSGWYILTAHDIQIQLCKSCSKESDEAPPLPKSEE